MTNSNSNLLNGSTDGNNTGDRKIIYIHNTKMKCLYASISHQRNLLAFTHFFVSNNQIHFQIFIVEINSMLSASDLKSEDSISNFQKQQNRYVFSPPQTSDSIFHCVQFIHPPQTADSNVSFDTKSCRFFLVTEKQSIRMFNISITESSSNFFINIFKKNQQSSINIEELVIFVKHFVWWQYDPVRSLLYYMLVREDMNNSRDAHEILNNELRKTNCSLRCISISEKKPNQLFECLIPVNIHRSLLSDSPKMKSDIIRMPWRSGPSSHDINSHFQIIRLENVGITFRNSLWNSQTLIFGLSFNSNCLIILIIIFGIHRMAFVCVNNNQNSPTTFQIIISILLFLFYITRKRCIFQYQFLLVTPENIHDYFLDHVETP